MQVVEVDDPPDAPLAGFRQGVFVASGQLVAPGVTGQLMSWAVSRSMLSTGGGLAFAIDPETREFSELGSFASPDSPAGEYLLDIELSDAYDQSRECAEG